ncbi:MAG: hypothetical protein SynsKO_06150 [Synoicihabitans sp.]
MPWDDASSTITDLSGLNTSIPLTSSWVKPNADGHLIRDGERLRFLGVNIGADSAFPFLADAEKIAARMAKFGMNTVRFHHLEAPWQPNDVLIDYSTGRSRDLSAERLDRLQHFVARLADHGIHTNMNLVVSREFKPGDGFPASIAEIEWKEQQSLSFFDDHMLTLQREYAADLLGAPNPHRNNVPLSQDPAVSFVEILNEYGYVQAWHDGTLDALPEPFATTHRTHWNDWLATRYADTAAVLTAWGTIDEPLGPELLTNSEFANGTLGWNLEQHDSAVATATGVNEFTGDGPSLRIDISTAGSAGWHVQLIQTGLSLTAGQIYTLKFWAKADTDLPLSANLTRTGPSDYSAIQSIANTTLTDVWQEFSTTFVATSDEPSVRLNFNGFGARTGILWIGLTTFTTGGRAGAPPEGSSLENRNLPTVLKTGADSAATPGQINEWFAYLLEAERNYFTSMRDYLRDDLGYNGVIFGTIVANSPPANQARLDAVDSHYYWQHPRFPGNPWDPVNWTIDNTSSVNTTNAHIGQIARQRVKGKPFFSTEYQHSAPGTYTSEMPILIGAYAAFQDWDGIWYFDYGAGVDEWDRGFISGFFAQDTHPTKMANVLLGAHLFRRGDVAAARTEATMGFDDATQLRVVRDQGAAWQVGDGRHLDVDAALAFETKLSLDVSQPAGAPSTPTSGNVRISDTGELRWDNSRPNRGIVTVDTDRTKAVVGFASGETIELNNWVFRPGENSQNWLTAGVTVNEGDSLVSQAGFRAVIVATGNVENTNQQWTDSSRTSVGTQWGEAPVLVEVVPLTLDVPFPPDRVQAWALDGTGNRTNTVPTTAADNGTRLTLGQSGDTLWYELAVTADPTVSSPEITLHPNDRLLSPGANAVMTVTATGTPPLSYTWSHNGAPRDGATGEALTLSNVTTADSGTYSVTVANAQGAVTSRVARVAVEANPAPSTGLANLSTRANSGTGAAAIIPSFVLAGSGDKDVLVRAVGPGLQPFGISTYMADPYFTLLERQPDGSQLESGRNDNWTASAVGDAFTDAGAFALEAGSADAALRTTVSAGIYTAPIQDHAESGGLSLVELYDLTNGTNDLRLRNLASRGPAGVNADQLIAGFVIPGDIPRRLLIRAIGPTLGDFGVTGASANPSLQVVAPGPNNTTYRLAQNDDWFRADNATELTSTMETVGAFPLPAGSLDAAVLVELAPGAYTALVNSDPGGIALVEIYEVD